MLMSMVTTGLLGFTLFAYLHLVNTEHLATARSQLWNEAMPIVEAGIEDALTHLKVHGLTNLACDGWQQAGNLYYVRRPIGTGWYVVTIANWTTSLTNCRPVIESRAYVPIPWVANSTPGWFVAQVGASHFNRNCLVRGVRVTTRPQSLLTKAIVAARGITLNGQVQIDSFDSEDPTASTDGRYDPAKARARGDVATNANLQDSLYSSGDVKIYGRVATGPQGTATFRGNSAAGSRDWIAAGNTGIQPGWYRNDMNVSFPEISVPFTGGYFTPQPGSYLGTNYTYLLGSGDYYLPTLTLTGTEKVLVTGRARLHVSGRLNLLGNAYLAIAPGASLELYVGQSSSIGGQGIINHTGKAHNFILYGLPTCMGITVTSTSPLVGAVYAPRAAFTMRNHGSTPVEVIGATVTATVNLGTHYRFHYDESLASVGLDRGLLKGFAVTSWNELAPEQVAALPSDLAAALVQN